MKVALVLVGHIRTLQSNWGHFKKIIDKHSCDVYIETWEKYGFWKDAVDSTTFTSANDKGFDEESDLINEQKIRKLTNPVYLNIDNFDDYNKFFNDESLKFEDKKWHFLRPKNLLTQWYKRNKIMNVINESGIEYDKVILTRPDLRISSEINLNEDKLQVSSNYSPNGYGDVLFIGTLNQINDLVDLNNNFENINSKLEGHATLRWWIKEKGISHKTVFQQLELFNTPGGYCKI